jgi:integrase
LHKFISTSDFTYKGRPYPEIPLMVDDEMRPVTVVNMYMLYLEMSVGRVKSSKTINNHIDALYDYFSWLEANKNEQREQSLFWDDQPMKTSNSLEPSNLALYQHWSQRDYKKPNGDPLAHSTINQRTGCILSFYKWARDISQIIDWKPSSSKLVAINMGHPDVFAHTHGRRKIESDNLKLPTEKKIPKLLSIPECRHLMKAPMSRTIKLMTGLMLATGIRNMECRTFPLKYVFNPGGLDRSKRIKIELDRNDMLLKNEKSRTVYLSWQLMAELYEYTQYGEGVERAKAFKQKKDVASPNMFLNDKGMPFSDKGLNNTYRKFSKGFTKRDHTYPPVLSFRVTPHMLRHTFATMELYHESKAIDPKTGRERGEGHALAWVKERLGHQSIQTTTIYLHCLHAMEDHELNEYQKDIDQMIERDSHD